MFEVIHVNASYVGSLTSALVKRIGPHHRVRCARIRWPHSLVRNEREPKPKVNGLGSLSFPMWWLVRYPCWAQSVRRPSLKGSLRIAVTCAQVRMKRWRAASTIRSFGRRGHSSTPRLVVSGSTLTLTW